jgi:hypothetical protein
MIKSVQLWTWGDLFDIGCFKSGLFALPALKGKGRWGIENTKEIP